MKTYRETLPKSHALIAGRAQFPVNARECIRCERDQRHNHSIIRIVRLKSDECGDMRTAGPLIEFAERHLSSVITALQQLQTSAMHPPPDPENARGATAANGSPKSQVSNLSTAEFKSEPLDLQARKLRGMFSFCHATACTIAALAFAGGPR